MNTLLIYDDTVKPEKIFYKTIKDQSFSQIIYKKRNCQQWMFEQLDNFKFLSEKIILQDNITFLNKYSQSKIIHIFSYVVIADSGEFELLLSKLVYSNINVMVLEKNTPLLIYFSNMNAYKHYMNSYKSMTIHDLSQSLSIEKIENNCLYNISEYQQFISFISGGFDARFFNKISGSEYTVNKSSTDVEKIKKEYTYYHILPENMKIWSVIPYNYVETETGASYDMERLHITDMAIRWIHNSVDINEFERFLNKAFHYLTTRNTKRIDKSKFSEQQNNLYVNKVVQRIEQLVSSREYSKIAQYVNAGSCFVDIETLIKRYLELYHKIVTSKKIYPDLVIGHGDFCFSNILYDKSTEILKLIDPKGALNEEQLWMDPYYDIAKISHSICGNYDYINNGLFSIQVNKDLNLELSIDSVRREDFKQVFIEKLGEHGFDYKLTRLFEASLFISMLPLHKDNLQKVLGLMLNANKILDEVENG